MTSSLASQIVMLIGFGVTAYAIVANNTPQTLGPFIRSNPGRPWWVLWGFAASVLVAVVVFGWTVHQRDICYGRLDAIPLPARYTWIHLVPPLTLLALTRLGIPASPTFLIVPAFATAAMGPMLINAMVGYLAGLAASLVLYSGLARMERHFAATNGQPRAVAWTWVQLLATGFLWSQWLIQNLANVFVYVPRQLSVIQLVLGLTALVALLAVVLRARGGATQRIVNSKVNLQDIRSATVLDLLYGSLLLAFLWTSKVPMSTTWVFLGMIGARELALSFAGIGGTPRTAARVVGREFLLASAGLVVSLLLALALPMLHQTVDRTFNMDGDVIAVGAIAR